MLRVLLSLTLFVTPQIAFAGDVYEACLSSGEQNGLPEGVDQAAFEAACTCLADSASGNDELTAELLALSELSADEINANKSSAADEAMAACLG